MDQAADPTTVKLLTAEIKRLNLEEHEIRPDGNDTIHPRHLEPLN